MVGIPRRNHAPERAGQEQARISARQLDESDHHRRRHAAALAVYAAGRLVAQFPAGAGSDDTGAFIQICPHAAFSPSTG